MKKSGIQWFVEPLNEDANSKIGSALAEMSMVDESSSTLTHKHKGRSVNLWRVERVFALQIWKDRNKLDLQFKIFYIKDNGSLWQWLGGQLLFDPRAKTKKILESRDIVLQAEKNITSAMLKISDNLKEYQRQKNLGKSVNIVEALGKIKKLFRSTDASIDSLIKIFS